MEITENISELIPQRSPFVLIDALLSCDPELAICSFRVPETHVLVDNGRLTEGGLTENMAQTAAAGQGYWAKKNGGGIPKGFIAGIKNIRISRKPLANSILTTHVRISRRVMEFNLITSEVYENEELIASCEMKIYAPA